MQNLNNQSGNPPPNLPPSITPRANFGTSILTPRATSLRAVNLPNMFVIPGSHSGGVTQRQTVNGPIGDHPANNLNASGPAPFLTPQFSARNTLPHFNVHPNLNQNQNMKMS